MQRNPSSRRPPVQRQPPQPKKVARPQQKKFQPRPTGRLALPR